MSEPALAARQSALFRSEAERSAASLLSSRPDRAPRRQASKECVCICFSFAFDLPPGGSTSHSLVVVAHFCTRLRSEVELELACLSSVVGCRAKQTMPDLIVWPASAVFYRCCELGRGRASWNIRVPARLAEGAPTAGQVSGGGGAGKRPVGQVSGRPAR